MREVGSPELARQPLLLTVLCLIFDETMAFPPRRAELYKEAVDALLKKWDYSKDIERGKVYCKLSLSHKRDLLGDGSQARGLGLLSVPPHTRLVTTAGIGDLDAEC